MKRTLTVLAVVATLLLVAGPAVAKPTKLEGKVKNDANSKVTLKTLKNSHGVVKKIKALTFTNVDYECTSGETGELDLKLGSYQVTKGTGPGGGPVTYSFFGDKTVHGVSTNVFGFSNRGGTKIKTAYVDFNYDTISGGVSAYCHSADEPDSWKAKKQ